MGFKESSQPNGGDSERGKEDIGEEEREQGKDGALARVEKERAALVEKRRKVPERVAEAAGSGKGRERGGRPRRGRVSGRRAWDFGRPIKRETRAGGAPCCFAGRAHARQPTAVEEHRLRHRTRRTKQRVATARRSCLPIRHTGPDDPVSPVL